MAPRPDFGKAVDETGTNNCVPVTILSRHWGGACVSFSNIFSNKHFENSIGICLHNDLFIFRTKIYFCMTSSLNIDIHCIMRRQV